MSNNFVNPICIYHSSCTDGFGAAWAVKEFSKVSKLYFTFFAAEYNKPPPNIKGKSVVIVDFSYPLEILKVMLEEAKSILIIDHHATAIKFLKDFEHPKLIKYLDNNKSGAGLAWEYFHNSPVPELIKYIEDRDLWKFKLLNTKEIIEAVSNYPLSFNVWDSLMVMPIERLRDEGRVLLRKTEIEINRAIAQKPLDLIIANHLIPTRNLTQNISETLNRIVTKENIPFSASFFVNKEGYIFSLRSIDSKEDVSKIAKMYGGGGHRNAAGFKVSTLEQLIPL